ncbi:putative metal-dependent phosphoesterase TrpH [Methanococcus voltae PS]|uniref:Metal-dependent phosphoesterase TrpH n=1 Tax=Methanococcus voltae PS TaxID=523842 RepID=A0ABT2EX72_METVO|nr:PHP-associated domain-containing protein [Methanococcus voltae]MCS3922440.1 putative metal-dependent phosphoesterase TrpH [Methanococcus voltae PS]
MKIDMHVHTINSRCSMNSIDKLEKICTKSGITPFIADHDQLTKVKFGVAGEEISTAKGEFIGLFLTEQINTKDIFEALDTVKEQGGLIYLPHPFDVRRRRTLAKFNILDDKEFIKRVDAVEVYNSRCVDNKPNLQAKEYAKKYDLLAGVGSDSHFSWELGNAYMEVEDFDLENPKQFLKVLTKANKSINTVFRCTRSRPLNMLFFSKLSKKIHKSGYAEYFDNIRSIF